MWSQDFGVMVATNTAPEPRKYTLIKANYLREQLRLYVQVSSGAGDRVYQSRGAGAAGVVQPPEEQVDRVSQLHVLWQTGAQSFSYLDRRPGRRIVSREIYDNFNSRPRLTVNASGEVVVLGGVRRAKVSDLPAAPAKAVKPQPLFPAWPVWFHLCRSSAEVQRVSISFKIIRARFTALSCVSPKKDFNLKRTAAM